MKQSILVITVYLIGALAIETRTKSTSHKTSGMMSGSTGGMVDMMPNLVKKFGYNCEEHTVRTRDGYMLTMHRIPFGSHESRQTSKERPVVLMLHGLWSSSGSWVSTTPDESLAFMLVDAGFDVWLGNVRGNMYSRRHEKLDPRSSEFWNFSVEEKAKYDVPAMIDYILDKTDMDELCFIGFGQGALTGLIAVEVNPELSDKIKLMVTLNPTIKYTNSKVPFIQMLKKIDMGKLSNLKDGVLLNPEERFDMIDELQLEDGEKLKKMLKNPEDLLEFIGGEMHHVDKSKIKSVVNHLITGTSKMNIIYTAHLAQDALTKSYFDFSNVKCPVAIIKSEISHVTTPDDVDILKETLPNVVFDESIEDYGHFDLLLADDFSDKVGKKLVQMLEKCCA